MAPRRKRHPRLPEVVRRAGLFPVLREVKRHVEMRVIDHTYAFGTSQAGRRHTAREYLFIAWQPRLPARGAAGGLECRMRSVGEATKPWMSVATSRRTPEAFSMT